MWARRWRLVGHLIDQRRAGLDPRFAEAIDGDVGGIAGAGLDGAHEFDALAQEANEAAWALHQRADHHVGFDDELVSVDEGTQSTCSVGGMGHEREASARDIRDARAGRHHNPFRVAGGAHQAPQASGGTHIDKSGAAGDLHA